MRTGFAVLVLLLVFCAGSVFAQDATPEPPAGLAAGSGLISGPVTGEAQSLNGAGATFPAVLYTRWVAEYAAITGVSVNYQAIGSGGGIKSISDGTVDFGASDGPMTDEQLATAPDHILHIPTALGGVVPVYNLPELPAGSEPLRFTAETLAGIYLGQIVMWNDPLLVAENPQLETLDRYIIVVRRSDGSGTTNIWTSYLTAVSETWANEVGAANSVAWPVGIGGQGNSGVAGVVKQTPDSIGYVELAYAEQNELTFGSVQNSAGNFILANTESVSLAAAGVELPEDMRVKLVNAVGEDAYPIAGFTWLLVYENQTDQAKSLALVRFLWWATHDGQQFNESLGYSPLPQVAIAAAERLINTITINGEPALPVELRGE